MVCRRRSINTLEADGPASTLVGLSEGRLSDKRSEVLKEAAHFFALRAHTRCELDVIDFDAVANFIQRVADEYEFVVRKTNVGCSVALTNPDHCNLLVVGGQK